LEKKEIMMTMENEEIKYKIKRFMTSQIPVHVILKLKKDDVFPRFYNGIITEEREGDIYVLEDRKIGKTYIFLEDIHDLRVFQKDNKTLQKESSERMGFKFNGEGVSIDEIDIIKSIDEKK
jgi:hypothetical protein